MVVIDKIGNGIHCPVSIQWVPGSDNEIDVLSKVFFNMFLRKAKIIS